VRDFQYLDSDGILFVTVSDMNLTSRIDAYLTNMTFPWEKKTEAHVTVGALFVFKVTVDTDDTWSFDRMWMKSFPNQTTSLMWHDLSNQLFVGLDSGKIQALKIPRELNFMQYDEVRSP
jgi:hypothetical protein